ncbi:MAG: DUF3426 domain-containing protein, partial [Rubrivivax sp.]
TVFRVVQDQLKVSEGWVRCGRCSEVFNAVDGLFDLDHEEGAAVNAADNEPAFDADERATLEQPSPARIDALMQAVTHAEPPQDETSSNETPPPVDEIVDTGTAQTPEQMAYREAERELAAVYAALTPIDLPAAAPHSVSPVSPALPDEPDGPAEAPTDGLSDWPLPTAADTAVDSPSDSAPPVESLDPLDQPIGALIGHETPTPQFLRHAERAERWRRPAVRWALAVLSLLLAATLAAQLALHYRDAMAAQWPLSRPWLQRACQAAGCSIAAPRRIDALSVDSSGLLRADGVGQYRLSLVLNNRAGTEVLMPAIDLVLTDEQGRTLVRRVLSAKDLGAEHSALAPRAELALAGMLDLSALSDLGERRVNGYTVELFYP